MRVSTKRRRTAFATVAVLTVALLVAATPTEAKARPFTPVPTPSVPGSDFVPPQRPADPTGKMIVGSAPVVAWPAAATVEVDLTGRPEGSLLAAPGLPVKVGARPRPAVNGEPV